MTTSIKADQQLFASIKKSPIATLITDPTVPDNPIVSVNEAFCRLTGYAEDEVIGRNCRLLVGEGTEAGASALLRQAVKDARPALVELLNYRKDGSSFRNAVMIAPCLGADGRPIWFVGSQMEVGHPPVGDRSALDRLTPRQTQVLMMMAEGLRNKEIAARLKLSEKTVKMHRAAMLKSLACRTSTDAIRLAIQSGA